MNFNLNLRVDKAMDRLSESKSLRIWTYLISLILLAGILLWQMAPILQAAAVILKVVKS